MKQLIPQSLRNLYHLSVAIAAVVRYGYPAKRLKVIGVTGTDGKTTTSTLIYHLLHAAGKKVALISTVAAYIGDDTVDTGFHVTSPDPWPLQQLIRRIADMGYEYLVLESTSHGFDQHRLYGTNIQYAVITNITPEHLDYHRTYDRYLAAKAKIFTQAKVAVLNQDDRSYPLLKPYIKNGTRLISYSLKTTLPLHQSIRNLFPETYNQANALAAATLAGSAGVDQADILQGLHNFTGVKGRMQLVPNAKGLKLVVDFAHTPNALEQALSSLKKSGTGKLIAVFGAAGLRDRSKRPVMGENSARLADEVVLTSEDPRTEDPRLIISQIKQGITANHGHVHTVVDRQQAINFALTLAGPGDTVAVLGKGHEQAMNLDGHHEIPWSDVAALKQALKKG